MKAQSLEFEESAPADGFDETARGRRTHMAYHTVETAAPHVYHT